MDSDILQNLSRHVFYHGTSLDAAEAIAREGFRAWFADDEDGHYPSGGNLGIGVYITCNWRTALWFGPVLLRVVLRSGTRLLNAALPPDGKCLDSVKREFGREILLKSPWKVLPRNKKLALPEVIALFRYHYQRTWEKDYGKDRDGWWKWPKRRERHEQRLRDFRSVLIRHGFHGYGHPADDNGIVVFAADRLTPTEVVAEVSRADYDAAFELNFAAFTNLDCLKRLFDTSGCDRARQLALDVAQRAPSPGDQ